MKTKKHFDFHMHTNYSDGILDPTNSVRTARLNDLDYFSITDHDTTDGLDEAFAEAKKYAAIIIPGVEISTNKYHILGLGIDYKNKELQDFLAKSRDAQKIVCERKVKLLQNKGIPITMEKIQKLFPASRLGKGNIWFTMTQDNECREFFQKIYSSPITYALYSELIKGKTALDTHTEITPEESIRQIHNAGGLAFIAHPFKQIKSLEEELCLLREQGLDGLEVQPNFNGRNKETKEYALKHNMLITYGSDWHGGIFGRSILTNLTEDNVLDAKLAEALGINLKEEK
jgi:predicted metal-dependent phosphoesterase TrpH